MAAITKLDPEFVSLGGMLPRVMRELNAFRENHRLLIILSCTFVELMIGTLVESVCKNGIAINKDTNSFPLSVRLTLLHELGVLTDSERIQFNWLRKQRNAAAHDAAFVFTKENIPEWANEDHREIEDLFSLCVNLIGLFWNKHVVLFREKLPLNA